MHPRIRTELLGTTYFADRKKAIEYRKALQCVYYFGTSCMITTCVIPEYVTLIDYEYV